MIDALQLLVPSTLLRMRTISGDISVNVDAVGGASSVRVDFNSTMGTSLAPQSPALCLSAPLSTGLACIAQRCVGV